MRISKAIHLLRRLMDRDVPTFLWGLPGVGKSQAVSQLALERNLPVIDFRAIIRDSVDLRGVPAVDLVKNIAHWLPPSDLPNVERHGPEGIFFMDELNAAPPPVQAACFGLVLDRKVGEYTMPKGWRIVAAGNAVTHGAAAQRMPTPLANRFAHIDIEPDVDDFITHGIGTGVIDPLILGLVRMRGMPLLHYMAVPANTARDLRAFQTPRSWERTSEAIAGLDPQKDIGFMTDLAMSIVGESAASELAGFVRTYNDLPPFETIVRSPGSAKLPTTPDGQYALTMMLAARVAPKQVEPAFTYTKRLSPEMQMTFAFDLLDRKDTDFSKTDGFVAWAAANPQLFNNGKRF